MPKNVQLPDGRIVEFPDSMSDDQISSVLRREVSGGDVVKKAPEFGSKAWLKEKGYNLADAITNAFPALGGMAGGILGGAAGATAGPGAIATVPSGAVLGAAVGGAGGESLRQIARRLIGFQGAPATPTEAAQQIRNAMLLQGALEAGGQVIGRAGQAVAPMIARGALRIPPEVEAHGATTGQAILDLPPNTEGTFGQIRGKLGIRPIRPESIAKVAEQREAQLANELQQRAQAADVRLATEGRPGVTALLPPAPTAVPLGRPPRPVETPGQLLPAARMPSRNVVAGESPLVREQLGSEAAVIPSRVQRNAYVTGSETPVAESSPYVSGPGVLVTRNPEIAQPFAAPGAALPNPSPRYPGLTMKPAVSRIDEAIARTNNPDTIRELTKVRNVLTKDFLTGNPLPVEVPPTRALQNRRDIGDLVETWRAQPGANVPQDVIKQVYGDINREFHPAVPGSSELDQQLSSLIPVRYYANRAANLKGITENLLTPKGSSLTTAGAGLGYGASHTPEGAFLGAVSGRVIPEILASPTTRMGIARVANSGATPTLAVGIGRLLTMPRSQEQPEEGQQ